MLTVVLYQGADKSLTPPGRK